MGALKYIMAERFISGAGITLALTVISMIAGIVLGLVLALMKTSRSPLLRVPSSVYIFLFRGTPVLLQMIFVFAALPQLGIRFSPFQSAVIALSLNEAAYMAEIIRAGLQSIDREQWTAGRVLGFRDSQIFRYIVLPQAARIIIPPTGNQFIGMLKTSALASVVAVSDLLQTAQRTASANFDYVNTLIAAAAYYLLFTTVFTFLQDRLERRMDVLRRRRPAETRGGARAVGAGVAAVGEVKPR
ncbi:MAG TPA: amino acid ABC transporter permease [Fibrobacteria bacterium]|nr:amino acid ABC transporter permease [Fibrobacteria bacterium]